MTTVAAWFLYTIIVTNLLGLAAVAGESSLRASGGSGRWSWMGAMLLSVALPLLSWAGWSLRSVPVVPDAVIIPLAPLVVGGAAPTSLAFTLDEALRLTWAVWTVGLVIYLGLSWLTLRNQRREWRPDAVEGVPVMVAREAGPAVFGVVWPDIVIPEWSLRLSGRVRRLMLLHEGEHVKAGDTRLMTLGLLILAAVPWNLPLWWHYRRLRQAVELDCDARVLRRSPDARSYGALLIEVGRRRSAPVLGVALAEPVSFLERRIRLITMRTRQTRVRAALSFAGLSVVLAGAAVCTRDPLAFDEPSIQLPVSRLAMAPSIEFEASPSAMPGKPHYVAMTVRPLILNTDDVVRALERGYPPLLRDAGIGGETTIWFYIDETGRVLDRQIDVSSGYDALDAAALRVSEVIRFSPAMNNDRRVAVWVSLPIKFSTSVSARPAERSSRTIAGPASDGDRAGRGHNVNEELLHDLQKRNAATQAALLADPTGIALVPRDRLEEIEQSLEHQIALARQSLRAQQIGSTVQAVSRATSPRTELAQPHFVPRMAEPTITNEQAVLRALRREAEAAGGLSGEAKIWFYVDASGKVLRTQLDSSSGNERVDAAAWRVAQIVEFTPAYNRNEAVAVWTSLPIRFSPR